MQYPQEKWNSFPFHVVWDRSLLSSPIIDNFHILLYIFVGNYYLQEFVYQ
jgi:hypothetical protein